MLSDPNNWRVERCSLPQVEDNTQSSWPGTENREESENRRKKCDGEIFDGVVKILEERQS